MIQQHRLLIGTVTFLLICNGWLMSYWGTDILIPSLSSAGHTDPRPPPQPDDRPPTNTSIAVCAIAKNEEAYLDEWIDYHSSLGFAHFYIYDNSWHYDLQLWGAEQTAAGRPITVLHFPGTAVQENAYRDCVQKLMLQSTMDTVAIFDIDEFLVLHQHANVIHLVDDLVPHHGALSITWDFMGASFQRAYSPRPVTQRFFYKVTTPTKNPSNDHKRLVKTITRLADIDVAHSNFNPHFLALQAPHQRVDTHRHSIPKGKRSSSTNETLDVAAFYHYRYRSRQEYIDNFLRGRANKADATPERLRFWQERSQRGESLLQGNTVDMTPWNHIRERNPLYRAYDQALKELVTPLVERRTIAPIALCTTLKAGDEAYVEEWLDFHFMLGVSRFYLFDTADGLFQEQVLLQHRAYVHILSNMSSADQDDVLQDSCLQLAKQQGDAWLALLRIRDFLILPTNVALVDLLQEYQSYPGLRLYRYNFGTSHRRIYQPKPVTKRFQYRDADVSSSWAPIFCVHNHSSSPGQSVLATPPSTTAVLYHFATYSAKEYLLRKKGLEALSVESSQNNIDIWKVYNGSLNPGTVHDSSAWEIMKRLNPWYAVFDELWIP